MPTFSSLVLCGGAARRMQGRDKPLELWANKTLVSHVLDTLPEGPVLISANRTLDDYRALGWPVIEDGDYEGPLAGVAAAIELMACGFSPDNKQPNDHDWLYVVAGDTPKLPADLAAQLYERCEETDSLAACVKAQRLHPLPLLVRVDALQTVQTYLGRGSRSVLGWLRELNHTTVVRADDEGLFVNINTPEELRRLNSAR